MSTKKGIVATWISIALNILLFAVKYWAGIVSNSVALIADAWHTLSDSISSLAVLLGLKVSNKPADSRHPHGHGRAELIASLFVGILLAVIGLNFFSESVLRLRDKITFEYGPVAIWVTIASVVIKEAMARYSMIIGKSLKSNSLIADGWHHRTDAISSVVILVGILAGGRWWWIDGVLGILVSIMIFFTTYGILKETISVMLGENIDPDMEQGIVEMGHLVNGNVFVHPHNFKIHHYGIHSELVFHISLPGSYSLERAHEIATLYESKVEKTYNIEVTIHVDAVPGEGRRGASP